MVRVYTQLNGRSELRPLRHITHIIYDLDGLLLDTEPFYAQATEAIVSRFGGTYDWGLHSSVMGKRSADAALLIVDALKLPMSAGAFLTEREERLEAFFPLAQPLPGALALTQRLNLRGVPQGIASSSTQKTFALKVSRHQEWFSLFATVVLGDDPEVMEGKPAPDIFLTAARRLQADPAQCLVFEDAINGVRAARAAGMAVVAVPDPRTDKDRFALADQVLESLTQFDASLWGLPA